MPSRIGMCLAPLSPKLLDMAMTLAGQPSRYWQGDYTQVAEANPLMRWCLMQHPGIFVAASIVAMMFYATLLYFMPSPWSKPVALIIILVHTYGAASWLMLGLGDLVYLGCLPVFIGARWVLHWTWKRMDTEIP